MADRYVPGSIKSGSGYGGDRGDADTAREYLGIFEKGKQAVNSQLFNGEYYIQDIDLKDKGILDVYAGEEIPCMTRIFIQLIGTRNRKRSCIDRGGMRH